MLPGLSLQRFNPLHCCRREAQEQAGPLPAWQRQFQLMAREWLSEARHRLPPTWDAPYFESGSGPREGQPSVLLDVLVQRPERPQAPTGSSLLILRPPQGRDRELDEFVGHVVQREVRHLLVLGDMDAPGLRRNDFTTARQQTVGNPQGHHIDLKQSPVTVVDGGCVATLDIQRCPPPSASVVAPAPHRMTVLHLSPRHAGLLDPDELRTVAAWIASQAGEGLPPMVAVTGDGAQPGSTDGLMAAVGELALSMALARRHPGRNPCARIGGRSADAPMRELVRELYQRHAAYAADWRGLCAVAATARDASEDMRASKWLAARMEPEGLPDTNLQAAATDLAPPLAELLPWAANPAATRQRWISTTELDNPAFAPETTSAPRTPDEREAQETKEAPKERQEQAPANVAETAGPTLGSRPAPRHPPRGGRPIPAPRQRRETVAVVSPVHAPDAAPAITPRRSLMQKPAEPPQA